MITVQVENTLPALLEGLALGLLHYDEVEKKAETIPYAPNIPKFKELLDMGMFEIVTARNEEGKMVGYFCMLVCEDILTGSYTAQEMGIYVAKECRGGSTFMRLDRIMNLNLKGKGYKEMRVMFKTGHNTQLPTKLGYEETERVYQKLL